MLEDPSAEEQDVNRHNKAKEKKSLIGSLVIRINKIQLLIYV